MCEQGARLGGDVCQGRGARPAPLTRPRPRPRLAIGRRRATDWHTYVVGAYTHARTHSRTHAPCPPASPSLGNCIRAGVWVACVCAPGGGCFREILAMVSFCGMLGMFMGKFAFCLVGMVRWMMSVRFFCEAFSICFDTQLNNAYLWYRKLIFFLQICV